MIITRHAPAFFKISVGDLVIAVNPPAKSSKQKASRFGADIVLQNINHEDMGGGADMNLGGKTPFVIDGPGEYEIRNVFIKGFLGSSKYAGKEVINTIYMMEVDNIKVCILGLDYNKTLGGEAKEGIDEVDLLLISFGEKEGLMSPADAYKLAVSLEPKAIIPISYDSGDLKLFLKEGGSDTKEEDKLTIKRKDLEGKEGDIIPISIS
jgi:L-ascorbate metabolism protein UlaG (beta-lactamase superfamily)